MGSKSSAPATPDPYATSAAQTQSNQATAQTQAGLNAVNLYTPLGSSVYTPTGAPIGSSQPQYNQNINLTPTGQQTLQNYQQQQQALGQIGNQLLPSVTNALGQQQPTATDINNLSQNASNAYYNQQSAYLDPQWETAGNQLHSQLANQGITQQSDPEAYNNAMDAFNRQKTFAYNQAQQGAINQGPQNAAQLQALYTQQQMTPFNELQALMGGSQVQMPQAPQTSPTQVAPTNLAGNVYNSYQGQLGAYNAGLASQNAMYGGLAQLGGTLGAAALLSDRRLKSEIVRIGTHPRGFGVYSYRIFGEPQIGVMADEVEKVLPEAVTTLPSGYKAVYYGRL